MGKVRSFFRKATLILRSLKTRIVVAKWIFISLIKYSDTSVIDISSDFLLVGGADYLPRRKGALAIGHHTKIHKKTKIVIDGGNLTIGGNCSFGESNIFNCFDNIIIEDEVLTADRVSFICNIHSYEDTSVAIINQICTSGPIFVGKGSWIGINSVILPNTHIGKNSVVAANAVVKGQFPDYCVLAGIPAKVIKQFNTLTNKWEVIKD